MSRKTKTFNNLIAFMCGLIVAAATTVPAQAADQGKQVVASASISRSSMSNVAVHRSVIEGRSTNADGSDDGSHEPLSTSSRAVRVVTTPAQAGEGVIRVVTRICGDADNWRSVAADNTITPPVYLVLLGQEIQVNCSSVTPAVEAPPAPPVPPAAAAPAVAAAPANYGWVNPVPGVCFGGGDSGFMTAGRPTHMGVDLPAGYGTPIHAVAAGMVSVAYQAGGAGNYTVIDHGGVWTVYMHQSSYQVTSGWVNAGDVIGYVGSTGNSSGPHLHFEVQTDLWNRSGGYQDPLAWMSAHGVGMWC